MQDLGTHYASGDKTASQDALMGTRWSLARHPRSLCPLLVVAFHQAGEGQGEEGQRAGWQGWMQPALGPHAKLPKVEVIIISA